MRTKNDIQKDYRITIKGRLVSIFNGAKKRARLKKLVFEITPEDLIELYYKQNGRCAITNLEMSLVSANRKISNPFIVSLDRVDSFKGYTKDNIQFICNQVNRMKSNLTMQDFIFWIKTISSQV